jgi:hypothetical protein
LFDWGKRGLGSELTDASVMHKSCGKPLRILVVCDNCKEVPNPHDVEVITSKEGKKSIVRDAASPALSRNSQTAPARTGFRKKAGGSAS